MALQRVIIGVIILISGQILVSTAQTNVCKTFGSGVIQTFSKNMFYLKSTCPFTLTRFTLSGVNCGITVQRNATGLMNRVEITVNKITTVLQDGKVTVEGSSISLPFDHTYQLVYQYGVFIKLRSKVLPFSVIWRSQPGGISSVWVQLDHDLLSDMTGVCGRLNGAETTAQLISANVMSDGQCVTEDTKPQKIQVCEALSFVSGCPGGKSAQNLYIDLCSRMPSTVNVYAKCAFFEEIAFACGNQSNFWLVWRSKTSCSQPTCPGDLKYQELGSAFPPTCTDPQPRTESLVSTCLPPAGTVLNDRADGFRCIDVKSCPCVYGGKTYPPGAERNSKCQSCVCVQGKWSCSANVCPPTCNMEGQVVTTFDGKQYRVPGKCTYVAASGSSWTVTVKYSDTDASIEQMYLNVYQEKYTFSANSVKLGQEEVTDLAQTDHTTVFWQSSMFVHVQTSFGMKIKVQVSPEIQLYIYLPPSVQTRGLCGIYNSNTEDDFTTSSGIIENAVLPFTQSWAIGDCNPPSAAYCVNTDNEIFAEQKCSQLRNTSSVFARCHDFVPYTTFFDACVQRTCQCTSGVQNCLCVALSNYAKACASQGIDVGDWRAEAGCGVTCNGNLMFSYTISACNRTCRSLNGSDPTCDVAADPVEGCGCLAGTHLNTPLECSSSALCMCHYQGGTTPPGANVIDGQQCLCENGVLQCSPACDCPKGKICVYCAQASVSTARRTCESLSKPFSGDETCTSGCYCPAGLIEDHSGGCVTQDNCTCEFSGSVYSSGQSVVTNCKKCTCRGGQWYCEGEPCPGVCEVFGNGQYNTFDSKGYRFDGNCQYTLVEDATSSGPGLFAVRVESVPCCDEALTCSRSISLDLQDVVTLTLRDMNVTETQKSGWHLQAQPLYSVHTVGLYIIISVPDLGLTVVWDKHTRVKIVLQGRWRGNVRGLCGNFDGVVTNDLLSRSSSVVFSTLEFGNSWKTAVPPCSDVTQEVFPCERHSYCEAWAQRRCMILLSDTFADCRLKVDPAFYYQACILESCSCEFEGRFLGFCTAVAAYAEACTAQNVCINWRTPDLCPVYCDYYNEESEDGWHYDPCGQTKTCGKKHIFTGKLEGCYPRCPLEAPYFDENTRRCSTLDKCTCYFNNTVVYPGGKVRAFSECCECIEGELICEYCAFTTTSATTQMSTIAPYIPENTTSPKTPEIPGTPTQTTLTTSTKIPSTTEPTTQPGTMVTEILTTTGGIKPTTLLTTTIPATTETPTTEFSTGESEPTPVPETTVSPTTVFSTGESEPTPVPETTVSPTTEFSTGESEPTPVPETTVSPTTEFSTGESEPTPVPETTVSPTTEFSTGESEPTPVPETTETPTTEFSTGESEPTTVPETTVSPTTEFSTGESEPTTVPETTETPTTEFSTGESEPTTVPETTETPTTEFSTGESEPTTVPETTVSPTTEFSTGESEPTTVPETTVSPTTEFSTGESEPTPVPETTETPTTEFSTGESEPTPVPETTETPITEFSTGESEPTTVPETTVSPTTEFSTGESEPTTVPETTETPTTEFSTGESEPTTVPETTETPTTEFSTGESEPTTVPETTETPTTEFSTGESEPTTVPETTETPTTEFSTGESEPTTLLTPTIPETTTATEIPSTHKETTTVLNVITRPPLTTHSHTSRQESTETTQVSTPYTMSTTSTTVVTVPPVPCRDPLRNQTWPSGAVWKEDCFFKTCRNSIIEMRPVICPTLVPPDCPRDLKRVVTDEEGCCAKWQCDCQCDLYGDPHYVSFSGTKFDFLENCTYTLVKEKKTRHHLSITVDNYFGNPFLFGSSVKGIVLKYRDDTVTLLVNDDYGTVEATLNQNPVQPPYVENGIRFEGTNYQVFVYLDEIRSHVSLDPENTLQITLAMENFQDNTEGQCGVCGGASCVRRNGRVESEDCCNMTAYEWIEEDPLKPYCASIPRHESCNPITPSPPKPPPVCVAPLCDLLRHEVFQECSENVDVETLVTNCRFDYCVAESNTSICSPLQHLSEQCKRLGYCVYWRNLTEGACDFACPEGMVFDECRSTPNDVCKGGVRVPGKFGTDSMRSGCFCPDNLTLAEEYKTTCVPECTNCKGPLGEPMPAGSVWESHCHICRCNNQTLTEECSPMPSTAAPQCGADSTLVSDCCDNQICVEKTCEHNGKTYKVGKTWKDSSQPCVTYRCTRTGTEIQTSVCPEQSCSEELRVWDEHHCCFSCNVSCAVRMTTMTVTLEGCTQEVKIPSCEGHCQSNTMWVRSGEVLQLEQERRCCREKNFETKKLSLNCNGAAPTYYAYNHITSCECQLDA